MSIAAVIQSKMIASLIEAMGPSATLRNAPNGGARAQVLDTGKDGSVSVNLGGVRTEVLLSGPIARNAALQPGLILNLRIDTPADGNQPARATLMGISLPEAGLAGQSGKVFGQMVDEAARLPSRYPLQNDQTQQAPSPRTIAGPMVAPLVVRQNGLAPLFANLEQVMADAPADFPPSVREAANQLLAVRLPMRTIAPDGGDLREAVARSGLMHEARLAAGDAEGAKSDTKALLLALKAAIAPLIAAEPEPEALLLLPHAADRTGDETSQPLTTSRPSAPRRDAQPSAQGIAEPSLAGKTHDLPLTLRTLMADTEAALDRLTLSQYASLPVGSEVRPSDQAPTQRWLAEVPLAFAQGTAVLPLDIEHEPAKREGNGADAPIWRVRFAVDGEPVGPLHALVTMQGKSVGVTVWAEREATSRMLHKAAPDLRDALTGDTFERAEVEIFTGVPAKPKLGAGQFLDRRS